MDPPDIFFKPNDMNKKRHCLTIKDAQLVQILHTHMEGFGSRYKLGTQDFYANGGNKQEIRYSHQRALNYFNAAIFQVGLAKGYVKDEPTKVYMFGIHHNNIQTEAKAIYMPTLAKPPFFLKNMQRPDVVPDIATETVDL